MTCFLRHDPRLLSLSGFAILIAVSAASAQSAANPLDLTSTPSLSRAVQDSDTTSLTRSSLVPAASATRMRWFSNRFAGEVGGGFNAPVGNDQLAITWGYDFSAGAGLHLSPRVSLLGEFQYIGAGLPKKLIAAEGANEARTRILSVTLNPVIDFFPRRTISMYLTGGGGFYHKVTTFAMNQQTIIGEGLSFVADHFTSNQGGANIGFGFQYRLFGLQSADKSAFFAESRYLFVNTPPASAKNGFGTTGLIPVTVGLRW